MDKTAKKRTVPKGGKKRMISKKPTNKSREFFNTKFKKNFKFINEDGDYINDDQENAIESKELEELQQQQQQQQQEEQPEQPEEQEQEEEEHSSSDAEGSSEEGTPAPSKESKDLKKIKDRQQRKKAKVKAKDEIKSLQSRIESEAPARGSSNLLDAEDLPSDYNVSYPSATLFSQLPISERTLRGLGDCHYTELTPIQRAAIPHALCGRDILGAARTGSGKTLAFIVPLIELLFRERWTRADGLGAVVLSPTRELSAQIFETLVKVGKYHNFSAGAVLGGKPVKEEAAVIASMNIVVATPGRLLYHFDNTPGIQTGMVKMLVLDEADRILDMGFSKDLNAILDHLSGSDRQTLLFSATQTRSVKNLARLSLKNPEYVSVDENSDTRTPENLIQRCVIIDLQYKLDTLASFIRTHTKAKIIVFVASCKQVRFMYEAFRKIQGLLGPVPILHLHGRMNQERRLSIYHEFCSRRAAVLFATDVAARGLDFPAVDWIVQVDCPDDVETYIHRVGRTARFHAAGQSLLMLLPSEKAFLDMLEKAKIPVDVMDINPKKQMSIKASLQGVVASNQDIKYLAQRAFVSYMRAVFLEKNKEVFNVKELPANEFAQSMGLVIMPQISFGKSQQEAKNQSYLTAQFIKQGQQKNTDEKKSKGIKDSGEKITFAGEKSAFGGDDDDDDDDDDIFSMKKGDQAHLNVPDISESKGMKGKSGPDGLKLKEVRSFDDNDENNRNAKRKRDMKFSGKIMVFDDDEDEENEEEEEESFAERTRKELEAADEEDKLVQKMKLKEKRQKQKQKMKEKEMMGKGRGSAAAAAGGATLNPVYDDDDDDDEEEESESESESESEDEGMEPPAEKRKAVIASEEELALSILNSRKKF